MKGLSREKKLQEENKNLKDLLEQVYDMSCLDDMINDLRSGEDDEMLLCNLSLKSQIMDALAKEESPLGDLKKSIHPTPKLTSHNSSKVLADHYEEKK